MYCYTRQDHMALPLCSFIQFLGERVAHRQLPCKTNHDYIRLYDSAMTSCELYGREITVSLLAWKWHFVFRNAPRHAMGPILQDVPCVPEHIRPGECHKVLKTAMSSAALRTHVRSYAVLITVTVTSRASGAWREHTRKWKHRVVQNTNPP